MIIDTFENWDFYNFPDALNVIPEFIKTLSVDTEEGKYELNGDSIFCFVASYETKWRDEAVLEAHQKYVDIQLLLDGEELIENYSLNPSLVEKEPFSSENDVVFFEKPPVAPMSVKLVAGNFCMLFPQDAHTPQLLVDGKSKPVKKVVFKVDVALFQ